MKKTKFLVYVDYGGLEHKPTQHSMAIEIEHVDDSKGLYESHDWVEEALIDSEIKSVVDAINPERLDLEWDRDMCVWDYRAIIQDKDTERDLYELFCVYIARESDWLEQHVITSPYAKDFDRLSGKQ